MRKFPMNWKQTSILVILLAVLWAAVLCSSNSCSTQEPMTTSTPPTKMVQVYIQAWMLSKGIEPTEPNEVRITKGGYVVYKLPKNTLWLDGIIDPCWVGLYKDRRWHWNVPVEYATHLALVYWDSPGSVFEIAAAVHLDVEPE